MWISSVAWESEGKYDYEVNGPGAVSGSLFQQEMISGLETQGLAVDIIADYPYKGVKIKRSRCVKHSGDSNDIIIPFANVPILGLLLKRFWIGHYVRKKIKEMGLEFTPKQYLIQFVIIVGATALVTYLYFYNIVITIIYSLLAVLAIPYAFVL